MGTIRWGILGAGKIAHRLMKCAHLAPEACFAAVASRDGQRARAFAAQYGMERAYDDYEKLYADPDIDIVYVATPHPFHEEQTLAAIAAGKHVLCEKPFALNAASARRMIAAAQEKGVFLMEAMWSRCFPAADRVRALLREGAIGDPLLVSASFCYRSEYDETSRVFAPKLGGGGLLDIGVYVIAFASMALGGGMPEVTGVARLAPTGVDEVAAISLKYPAGGIASLTCATRVTTPSAAVIYGSKGSIAMKRFWSPDSLTLADAGGETRQYPFPREAEGFQYEISHVCACIAEGRLESPLMPWEETVNVARTMDALRARWGVVYPGE